jgi:tetratricopeptide (TPR) repeat protein
VCKALRIGDAATLMRVLNEVNPALKQTRLARACGVDQSTVSRVLRGQPLRKATTVHAVLEQLQPPLAASSAQALTGPDIDDDQHDALAHIDLAPSQASAASVTAVEQILASQRRLDDVVGAEALIPVTLSHMGIVSTWADRARGPHAHRLRVAAAEYVQFAGWLHASTGRMRQATRFLDRAEAHAQEVEEPTLIAQARNFRGYIARHTHDPHAVVRHFLAAYSTPGAHPAQRMGDAAQAAQGYAVLGERDRALRLLESSAALSQDADGQPPPVTAYWLTGTFQRLNQGIAHLALGEHDVAADLLGSGLSGLPGDQQGADWTVEYRQALETARHGGGQ